MEMVGSISVAMGTEEGGKDGKRRGSKESEGGMEMKS